MRAGASTPCGTVNQDARRGDPMAGRAHWRARRLVPAWFQRTAIEATWQPVGRLTNPRILAPFTSPYPSVRESPDGLLISGSTVRVRDGPRMESAASGHRGRPILLLLPMLLPLVPPHAALSRPTSAERGRRWSARAVRWLRHPSSSPHFRGGVTPAGSGTCATFSVIDTRL